ncbi:uncharacterized protein C8Q71DRAFT_682297, partial [Rhodofomes roseus]
EEAYLRKAHPTLDDIPGACCPLTTFSPGTQLTSLCRYGHLSVCGLKLAEFKSFMSLKGLHPEERRDVWIPRRAEWQVRRRMEKSSEDVMSDCHNDLPLSDFPARVKDSALGK